MTAPPDPPRDHVRRPDLPWRVSRLTECGRDVNDVKALITRDELLARLRKDGRVRVAFTVCMTCWQTATRWKTFAQDPVDAIRREVYLPREGLEEQLRIELRGLAALADKYHDEFKDFVTGLGECARFERKRK